MKNKKVIPIILLLFIGGFFYYSRLPDYKVFNSYSQSSNHQKIRDTKLNVIVYRYWDYDTLLKEIREEHNIINGEPTSLEINLYYSEWHLHHSKPFLTRVFEKE